MTELQVTGKTAGKTLALFAQARRALAASARHVGRLAFDVALPQLCPSCREPLGDGAGLCGACWSKLSLIEPPYCARLGIPFLYDPGPGLLSMEAIANPPAYDRARAAVRYDDVARALVVAYKFNDRLDLAPLLAKWMLRAGRELLDGADALIPVPLHWRRLWARRFNQSATLAEAIARQSNVPALHRTLRRVRATPQQVGLSKTQRADNVQGAFSVPSELKSTIAGKRLVLIDDVLTSGATVDTCARALLRAGAAHVDVLVFARVVAGGPAPYKEADEPRRQNAPVEIYTTRYCPYCVAAKALLKRKGVAYSEIDVGGDIEERQRMVERANGRMTVPQIFIGAVHVGGNDDLQALERTGKLDPLLKGEGQSR